MEYMIYFLRFCKGIRITPKVVALHEVLVSMNKGFVEVIGIPES